MVHEWSLAQAIAEALKSYSKRNKISAYREVTLSIGELQNIDIEILLEALENIIHEWKEVKIYNIKYEVERAEFLCKECGYRWRLDEMSLSDDEREAIHFLPELIHAFVRCVKCGSPDFSIVEGRGIKISRIVVGDK